MEEEGMVVVSGLEEQTEEVKELLKLKPRERHPSPPHRQNMDITFEDIVYSVPLNRARKEWKILLKGISGCCRTGELTAIMGPSGAGKSTLMNVLAGYKIRNLTSGKVKINGEDRDLRHFRKLSCYIMQDDELLPHLTVMESMMVAANLKLSEKVTRADKKSMVCEIMNTLGLLESKKTKTSELSGGQRKRLSIALELVNNPPIMFFDEPTSGLDSMSCYQCLSLLKTLAIEGRTIICTIHQPSAKLFEMFDRLIMMADGKCIYKGLVRDLLPFLATQGLQCPAYHNPADYVIEVACGEYGDVLSGLAEKVEEGLCERVEAVHKNSDTAAAAESLYNGNQVHLKIHNHSLHHSTPTQKMSGMTRSRSLDSEFGTFATNSFTQFCVLFDRTFKSIIRDTNLTGLRLLSHTSVGVLIGLLYLGVGDEATKVVNNAACLFFSMLFLMFTALMPTVMTFPIERTVLIREHLNYWYSLKAYYFAKTMADTPFQIIFPVIYGSIVYWMTGQPNSALRFTMFLTFTVLVSLTAQACGLFIGAACSLQVAIFLGPVTAIPILLFSGFFVSFKTIPPYLQWLSYASYVRYAFEGCLVSIYDFDRPPMQCEKTNSSLCVYKNPKLVLEMMEVEGAVWWVDILFLLAFFIAFRLGCYFVLRWRVRSQF